MAGNYTNSRNLVFWKIQDNGNGVNSEPVFYGRKYMSWISCNVKITGTSVSGIFSPLADFL